MTPSHPRRRAVNDDQKEVRRQGILEAAWRLFQDNDYDAVTMADVALMTGLAKGTLFLYFKTKEALFLDVVKQQLIMWFEAVDRCLAAMQEQGCTTAQVAEALCEELECRPGLIRLLAILHIVLERNVDLEMVLAFKHMLREQFARTGTLLEGCLPFLVTGQGAHFLLQCHALVIGFWHMTDPSPIARQALQCADLKMFALDFADEFAGTVRTLLYGLEQSARTQ